MVLQKILIALKRLRFMLENFFLEQKLSHFF